MSNITVWFKLHYLNKNVKTSEVNKTDIINSLNGYFRNNNQIVNIVSVSFNEDILTVVFDPQSGIVLKNCKNLCIIVSDKYEIKRVEREENELKSKSRVHKNQANIDALSKCQRIVLDTWENEPTYNTKVFSIHSNLSRDKLTASREKMKQK